MKRFKQSFLANALILFLSGFFAENALSASLCVARDKDKFEIANDAFRTWNNRYKTDGADNVPPDVAAKIFGALDRHLREGRYDVNLHRKCTEALKKYLTDRLSGRVSGITAWPDVDVAEASPTPPPPPPPTTQNASNSTTNAARTLVRQTAQQVLARATASLKEAEDVGDDQDLKERATGEQQKPTIVLVRDPCMKLDVPGQGPGSGRSVSDYLYARWENRCGVPVQVLYCYFKPGAIGPCADFKSGGWGMSDTIARGQSGTSAGPWESPWRIRYFVCDMHKTPKYDCNTYQLSKILR